ncbi:unnamed protein product [Bursaphelenchus okinawaensis]|uniref:Glycosyltransferase family 92 protein n=1 Tax=Bursaphelenchus okinawaensis TaxID=465554 RepID=A0A811KT73_9BILA|nr:unnamed protein product [Bursaphelenchus okinawaensis]CAG9112281.1 unnamed protein product [Bursaphelenchus okinawaensis]
MYVNKQKIGPPILYLLLFLFVFTCNKQWADQEIAVISATYFSDSKSGYPENTMAILFNSQKRLWPPRPFLCVSNNGTKVFAELAKIRYAFEPIYICRWATYLMTCPVVGLPNGFALSDTRFSSATIQVPYRTAVQQRMGVVACFSPLFYNERWQLIIPTLEIYRQLGVDMQVFYIQSMLTDIMDYMKVYEKLNIIKINTWNMIRLDPNKERKLGYDPNAELEWRNQATAHTDCFLNYKQAAEFIIISDIDDILFPKLGETYLEEFRRLAVTFPLGAGFSYSRYNTELIASKSPQDYSLSSLINSAKIANEWEDGKYVVRPKFIETVWLHWPGIMDSNYKMYAVDEEINIMVHMRNWSIVEKSSPLKPAKNFDLFKYQISDVIQPQMTHDLERNFRRFLRLYAHKEFERLPNEVRYYPLIEECYNRIFYGRSKRPESCPGPLRCDLPKVEGLRCSIARKVYEHDSMNTKVKIHFAQDGGDFVISYNGCTM